MKRGVVVVTLYTEDDEDADTTVQVQAADSGNADDRDAVAVVSGMLASDDGAEIVGVRRD